MKIKNSSVITASLIATLMTTLLLGLAGVIPVYATNGAKVFVDPKDNIFPPPGMGVGDTFTVNVTLANITGLAGLEFELHWNSTLLNAISMQENLFATVTPPGEAGNIWQLIHIVDPGYAWYAYTYKNLTRAALMGYAPINITTAEGYPEGKLAAATITLQVMKAPTKTEGFVECDLDITVSKPGDMDAKMIPHTVEDGYYKLSWSAPTPAYFKVDPPNYEATSLGEVFNVSIRVCDLSSLWEAVGFEFKLGFNSSILEALNVYPGPWILPYGNPPNSGVLNLSLIAADYVLVGEVILPDVNGTWHTPFPSTGIPGSGVLAKIEFNATYQGTFPESASCILDLYDTKIGDWQANPVNQTAPIDGIYSIRPKVLGRMIDIYTQYPDPYGGQGLNKPSDMFWPQKPVTLHAEVTYNEWPEQNKDVAFQIIDPHDDTYATLYARTDSDGLASVIFTLPWPCDDPEYYFGEWLVVGTVDIACEIVNDTMPFKYDYLVHITKITLDSTSYKHCDYMNITVEYKSYAMQTYVVILTVTAIDETGVPFGFISMETAVGGAEYCTYREFSEEVSIHVEKWARAGTAKIVVGFLNDWPFNGGTVMSGPYPPEEFAILAE